MAQATTNTHPVSSADRPERSRNAKAQARHRAKRKAYIEQVYTYPIALSGYAIILVLTVHFIFRGRFWIHARVYAHIARADRDQAPDGARALARASRGPAATNAAYPPARTRKLQAHARERRAPSPDAHAGPTAVAHDRPTFRHRAPWLVPVVHLQRLPRSRPQASTPLAKC